MENALQRYDMTQDAMTPATVVSQVQLIQHVMEKVMKQDEHYGIIPGCGKKPSLLKAGAEKLSLTFRLAPSYEVTQKDLPNGHREYYVKCTLTHIPTDKIFGQGVGACSTMEGKYRFRTGEVEFTGKEVPKEYWTNRDINLIGGKGFSTKKNDKGKWEIVIAGEKVEHDNPADYYNTVLKMAKKRAHVDAVLTATAASDIFTQDVEDMPEVITVKTETPQPKTIKDDVPLEPSNPPPQEKTVETNVASNNDNVVPSIITSVTSKAGVTNNKPWKVFFIETAAGDKYGTFDDKIADLATSFQKNGELAKITWKDGKKAGTKEVVEIAA
jgi:hypothetical protein